MHAEDGQVHNLAILCTECGAYNSTDSSEVAGGTIGEAARQTTSYRRRGRGPLIVAATIAVEWRWLSAAANCRAVASNRDRARGNRPTPMELWHPDAPGGRIGARPTTILPVMTARLMPGLIDPEAGVLYPRLTEATGRCLPKTAAAPGAMPISSTQFTTPSTNVVPRSKIGSSTTSIHTSSMPKGSPERSPRWRRLVSEAFRKRKRRT